MKSMPQWNGLTPCSEQQFFFNVYKFVLSACKAGTKWKLHWNTFSAGWCDWRASWFPPQDLSWIYQRHRCLTCCGSHWASTSVKFNSCDMLTSAFHREVIPKPDSASHFGRISVFPKWTGLVLAGDGALMLCMNPTLHLHLGNQSGAAWTPHRNTPTVRTAVRGLMFLCSVCASAVQPWIQRGTTIRPGAQPSGRRRSRLATTLWCCWSSSACSPSTCSSTPSASCSGMNLPSSWFSSCKQELLNVATDKRYLWLILS